MNERFIDRLKARVSDWGLYITRRYPNCVNGRRLRDDLPQIVPGDAPLCFDIGANTGQTIDLLQRTYRRPVIHAFEPASATFAALRNQAYGADVHLHPVALGETVGMADFRNYQQSELSSFLAMNPDRTENLFANEAVVSIESVRVDTLDHFCAAHQVDQIDLLKIDTQGFELPVLRGGADLFRRAAVRAVLLELNFATLYEGQSDPLEILRLLRNHNLRLVDYYEKERIVGKELSWVTALFMRTA